MLIILLKFSLNQRPPPPTSPTVFDAGTFASVFTRLHELLDKFQGRRTPPPENVGSDRRSPTAGPSDIARPNPLAQVADSASQGPVVAPGPSMATHVPPASGPSHHDAPSSGKFASARVGEDDWEHDRFWSRRVSSPERLRDELEQTHTKITQLREIIDFSRARGKVPPDHYYRDLDILHAEYDQLSLALVESREAFASSRRGRSPDIASPGVASPAASPRPPRPDSSSRTGLCLSPQPGPSSSGDQRFASQDRHRPRDASSDHSRQSGISEDRSRERFAARDQPSDRRQFASRDPPLQSDGDSLQGIPPLQSDGDSLQRILIHLSVGIHPVPRLVMVLLRDPHRGLLLPVHLRLLGKIKTLMNLLYLPRFGL